MKPLRVLFVEDCEDDAGLISLALRRDGCELTAVLRVETAEEMKKALDQDRWDVVLSDYSMPRFSGLNALSVLKASGQDIPFILVSGRVGEEAAVAAMRAGAHDYVMKGNLARLAQVIQRELSDADTRRERGALEETLEHRECQHRLILDTVGDGILMLNLKGMVVYVNPTALTLLGCETDDCIGKPIEQFIGPYENGAASPSAWPSPIRKTLSDGIVHSAVYERFQHKEGTVFSVSYVSTPIRERNEVVGAILVFKDLADATLQRAFMATLEYHAMHDPLTHLPNRTLFYDRLKQALLGAQREEKRLALIMLDLDDFKKVNDTLGHAVGDRLLQEVGLRLRGAVRGLDTAARLGGDEFGILLKTDGEVQSIAIIASKIQGAVRMPYTIQGHTLDMDASLGVALFPDHGNSADLLLERADIAMFSAKRKKSGYALYTSEQDKQSSGRVARIGELRAAINAHHLRLHYQPKVSLKTGHTVGAEALVRWKHPGQGLMLPDQFVPLAEQTELILALTQWVVDATMTQCHNWRQADIKLPIGVNLSGRDLQEAGLSHRIAEHLRAHQLPPECLEMEIVESTVMFDGGHFMSNLWHLKQMGIKLSIDDFGTGYSSLSYLKKLPVDEIKIDRSFVSNMILDKDNAAIVSSTIDLAHNLGLSVVAEGVENKATWDRLCDLGCDMAQGYYIHRPSAADEITAWLTESPMGLGV